MLKNSEVPIRSTELALASDKFEVLTKVGLVKRKTVVVRPVAQLVEHRTPNLLPVRARVRDASALDI